MACIKLGRTKAVLMEALVAFSNGLVPTPSTMEIISYSVLVFCTLQNYRVRTCKCMGQTSTSLEPGLEGTTDLPNSS